MEDFLDTLLIIIVTYKENFNKCKSFESLLKGIEKKHHSKMCFFIYDNSPSQFKDSLEELNTTNNHINITYFHDSSNPGLGIAYNKGAKLADTLGKKWLLLLDQDTSFSNNILQEYYKAVRNNVPIEVFAPILFSQKGDLISPSKYLFKRGFKLSYIPQGLTSLKRITPINSGILITTQLFNLVGGYNERIRLDFSDHAFMDKIRSVREYFFVINSNSTHNLSSESVNSIEKELIRFSFLCEGAKVAAKDSHSYINYFIITFLRGIKLSLKFGKNTFFIILFRNWFYS